MFPAAVKIFRTFPQLVQASVSLKEVENRRFTAVSQQRRISHLGGTVTSCQSSMGGGRESKSGMGGRKGDGAKAEGVSGSKNGGKQTSIASFFGGGPPKASEKSTNKQPSIASFFAPAAKAGGTTGGGSSQKSTAKATAKDEEQLVSTAGITTSAQGEGGEGQLALAGKSQGDSAEKAASAKSEEGRIDGRKAGRKIAAGAAEETKDKIGEKDGGSLISADMGGKDVEMREDKMLIPGEAVGTEKARRRKRVVLEEEDEELASGSTAGKSELEGQRARPDPENGETPSEEASPEGTAVAATATPSPPEAKPPRPTRKGKAKAGGKAKGPDAGEGELGELEGGTDGKGGEGVKKRRRLCKTSDKQGGAGNKETGKGSVAVAKEVRDVEMEDAARGKEGREMGVRLIEGKEGEAEEEGKGVGPGTGEEKDVRSFFLGIKKEKQKGGVINQAKDKEVASESGANEKEGDMASKDGVKADVEEGGREEGRGAEVKGNGKEKASENKGNEGGQSDAKRVVPGGNGEKGRKQGGGRRKGGASGAAPSVVVSASELAAGKKSPDTPKQAEEEAEDEDEKDLVLVKNIGEEGSGSEEEGEEVGEEVQEEEVEEVQEAEEGGGGTKVSRGKSSAAKMVQASKNGGKGKAKTAVKRKGTGKNQPGVGDGLAALALKHGDYDPRKAATWKPGEHVPFAYLAQALEDISRESGRLAITELLCNVFRTIMETTPEDLLPIVYLAANRVASPHEGVELGIGDATIIKTLAESTGRKEAQIKSEYKECGDLGLVAKSSRLTQRTMFTPQPLTCVKVFEAFQFIAKESGSQSNDKKRARMKQLIVAARENEPQFIVRLLQGKMRIGLAEQTVLAALAQAAVLQEKPPVPQAELPGRLEEAVRFIKQAYSVLPVYEKLVGALLEGGVRSLPEQCRFTLGVPVGPMLAKPTKGISEILDKFQDSVFTCEYKYDGERAQIHHLEDGTVEIYSRNAERNTQKFPDITAAIHKYKKPGVTSFVLDAEAVAYDREKDRILPFQVLSTRARKGVIMGDIKVQVCLYAFDLLYINGRELLQEQLVTRRQLLYNSFVEAKGEFQFATAVTTRDTEEMQAFLNEAVNSSCEGCMVKTLERDATYEPSKRSNNWLKLKKDYMDNLGDSLDLVPIGAFHGKGKRAGVFGAFLLACYDDSTEEFQSICKIGTGFSEAVLEERSRSLRERTIPKPTAYYRYPETLGVDVWFEPAEVWEVRAADLSISPVHRAANGMIDASKGIALRFPRFLRVRDDKAPEQATTAEQVADLYRAQKINHQSRGDED